VYVSCTRITDYKHRPADVLAGATTWTLDSQVYTRNPNPNPYTQNPTRLPPKPSTNIS